MIFIVKLISFFSLECLMKCWEKIYRISYGVGCAIKWNCCENWIYFWLQSPHRKFSYFFFIYLCDTVSGWMNINFSYFSKYFHKWSLEKPNNFLSHLLLEFSLKQSSSNRLTSVNTDGSIFDFSFSFFVFCGRMVLD